MTFEEKLYTFVEKWRFWGIDTKITAATGIARKTILHYRSAAPKPTEQRYKRHMEYYTTAAKLINEEGLKYKEFKPFKL